MRMDGPPFSSRVSKRLVLLRNLLGQGVRDATVAAALARYNWGRWASSAGFADLNGDRDLDLVLVNYVQFGPNQTRTRLTVKGWLWPSAITTTLA